MDGTRDQAGPGSRDAGTAATASHDSFPCHATQGVHPFLASAGAERWVILLYKVYVLA